MIYPESDMRYPESIFSLALFLCILAYPLTVAASETQPRGQEALPSKVTVSIPETIGDGTAFPCSFKAPGLASITVAFLNSSVTAPADKNGEAVVLLPVPLDHADADAALIWKAAFTSPPGRGGMPASGAATVKIRKKIYPAQHLALEQKYVTPDPALEERIENERRLLNKALTTRSPVRHWTLPMLRPVPGKVTSWYGLRRILNGRPRSPHKGLDFRGAEGTPIASIADGTVVLTGDFYYPGKFVVVDHGLGVTSIYMHMSGISATDGQVIRQGDLVGLVGMTGRSTGPHLHLGIMVLGQAIDAFPLLAMTPEDRAAYEKAFSDAAAEASKPAARKSGQSGKKRGAVTRSKKGPAKKIPGKTQ